MDRATLKNPPASYPDRFNRFLWLLILVKGLEPKGWRLWHVMDGVAFQDTETALETELYNAGQTLDIGEADRMSLAVWKEKRRAANN